MKVPCDFYSVVYSALAYKSANCRSPVFMRRRSSIEIFLESWRANLNIKLKTENSPVYISKKSFYKKRSGTDSLEYIWEISMSRNVEMPFAGIFDEKNNRIVDFFVGPSGDRGSCSWDSDNFLSEIYYRAGGVGGSIVLGHTHPKGYGTICSCVDWSKETIESLMFYHPDTYKPIIDARLHKKFGGDYCEMLARKNRPHICNLFFIFSPRENQIGIFEIHKEGLVVYRPWILV